MKNRLLGFSRLKLKFWRVNFILLLVILFGATIIGRLVFLQVLNYDFYRALAKGQQNFFSEIFGERGEIFLQAKGDLYHLAINRPTKFCFASPWEITDKEGTAKKIKEILNLDLEEAEILTKIKDEENLFVPLKYDLTDEEIQRFEDLDIEGIYIREEKTREYPQESLAAHIVGFLGGDGTGQYGIEGYYDAFLKGESRFVEGEKGPQDSLLFFDGQRGGDKGSDLVLTIDYNIQFLSEKLLEKAGQELNIEGGSIIVMDPNSGKILALANFPSFDPNLYAQEDLELFQNGTCQKIFEPGSVFKPITFAIALNEGKITPQTTYIDKGIVEIGGWPIYNYGKRTHGEQTMVQVLEKSINTGAVFVEERIPHNVFLDYIEKFGICEPTKVDLQGEGFSHNKELKKGYEVNFATASFGQGIGITPIGLARAFCVIANGGKLIKPYIVDEIRKSNGEITQNQQEIFSDDVISSKTASQLTTMLVSVVENGFAKKAKVPGYYIAGKTGTAQIPFSVLGIDKRGYSNKTWQTFVGFAPAFDPKFLIVVKLDNPSAKTAEYSAVPIFQDLAEYVINYLQIPPDYEE